MAKGDEAKLVRTCLPALRNCAREFGLQAEQKVKVLSDITCVPDREVFSLVLGFAEVDLCLYRRIDVDKRDKTLPEFVKLRRDSKNDRSAVNIPLCVFELKRGHVTTDAIRSRSIVAEGVRRIFPFCYCAFLADDTSKSHETLFRQGKGFDDFFVFEKQACKKQFVKILEGYVKPHLLHLKSDKII